MSKSRGWSYYGLLSGQLGLLLLLALALARGWQVSFHNFAWTRIEVYASSQQITQNQVLTWLRSALHKNMIGDSLERLATAMRASPWTKQLRLVRCFPGVLQLDLVEREIIAIWLDRELIDQNGARLPVAAAAQPLPILPHLSGSEKDFLYIVKNYRQLQPILQQQQLRLAAVHLHTALWWEIDLVSGVKLKFLTKSERDRIGSLAQQFNRFAQLYPRILQQLGREPQSIDFRYQNGNFAVK